jgi:hypothetical protein
VTGRRCTAAAAIVVLLAACAACGGGSSADRASTPRTTVVSTTATVPIVPPTTVPVVTTVPEFAASVAPVTAADLGASWRAGCPVGPDQLRRVALTYWDFDGRVQQGALVVHLDAVDAVQAVFRRLFDARFPIRRMETIDRYGGSDDASMAADNTSAFNCRSAVRADGVEQWSSHAFGRAIDVNPVENPYVLGSTVLPPDGTPYTDRADVRPGMAVRGGPLVDAFAAAGWQWGGRWTGSPDYQHFSADGG